MNAQFPDLKLFSKTPFFKNGEYILCSIYEDQTSPKEIQYIVFVDPNYLSRHPLIQSQFTLGGKKYFSANYFQVENIIEIVKTIFTAHDWLPISQFDFQFLEHQRFEWALTTFPEATDFSSLQKLKEEISEIEENIKKGIKDPIEYADALMCLFDSAGRNGISVSEIAKAFSNKLEINKSRKWVKNADNTYSHEKKAPDTLQDGDWFIGTVAEYQKMLNLENNLRSSLYDEFIDECFQEGGMVYSPIEGLMPAASDLPLNNLDPQEFFRRADNTFGTQDSKTVFTITNNNKIS